MIPNTNASTFAYNVPRGGKTLAWRVGWAIPELSTTTRAAAGKSDAVKRRSRYQQLQTQVQQQSPFVVMLQGTTQVAVRATVSDPGPLLLARLLNLNEVQSGVLQIIFRIADDQGKGYINILSAE